MICFVVSISANRFLLYFASFSATIFSYSGHGTKLRDDDVGEEDDGFDEALVPLDFKEGAGMIRDDDLYELLIDNLADGVHMLSLMDCCHSGTILDLPYIFKGDGTSGAAMKLNDDIDLGALISKFAGVAETVLGALFG